MGGNCWLKIVSPRGFGFMDDWESALKAAAYKCQTMLREIVGELDLDNLVSNRAEFQAKVNAQILKVFEPLGLHSKLEIRSVRVSKDMTRQMATEAESQRTEKRAAVVNAQAEVD